MYESPIDRVVSDIVTEMEQEREQFIMRCVHKEGINVDRDELIKALNYDRNQYQKGYSDGKNYVLDRVRAEIIELRSRQNVGVLECLDIIDKYREVGE